jgi:hypothetical protein
MNLDDYDLRNAPKLIALRAEKNSLAILHVFVGFEFSMKPGTSVQSVQWETIMR